MAFISPLSFHLLLSILSRSPPSLSALSLSSFVPSISMSSSFHLSRSLLSRSPLSPLSFSTHTCASHPSPCLSLLSHSLLFPFPPLPLSFYPYLSLVPSLSFSLSHTHTSSLACMNKSELRMRDPVLICSVRPAIFVFRQQFRGRYLTIGGGGGVYSWRHLSAAGLDV